MYLETYLLNSYIYCKGPPVLFSLLTVPMRFFSALSLYCSKVWIFDSLLENLPCFKTPKMLPRLNREIVLDDKFDVLRLN